MENPELEKLQYPIGKYTAPDGYSPKFIKLQHSQKDLNKK